MILNVKNFLESPDRTWEIKGVLEENESDYILEGIDIEFPIEYRGVLYNLNPEIKLDLSIKYKYNTSCDRCLKKLQKDVESFVCCYFIKDLGNLEDYDDAMTEYFELKADGIDLSDIIISQVISDTNNKHLCSENCKGLCPKCGKDLNKGPCDCEQEREIDPRFEGLLNLFNEEV